MRRYERDLKSRSRGLARRSSSEPAAGLRVRSERGAESAVRTRVEAGGVRCRRLPATAARRDERASAALLRASTFAGSMPAGLGDVRTASASSSALQQDAAQVVVRLRVVGPEPQRLADTRLTASSSRPGHRQRRAEVEVRRRRDPGFRRAERSKCATASFGRPRLQVQHRHVVVERDARGLGLNHPLVTDHVLGHHLRRELRRSALEIGGVRGQHLNPEIAHLVRRTLAPEHARAAESRDCAGSAAELS